MLVVAVVRLNEVTKWSRRQLHRIRVELIVTEGTASKMNAVLRNGKKWISKGLRTVALAFQDSYEPHIGYRDPAAA